MVNYRAYFEQKLFRETFTIMKKQLSQDIYNNLKVLRR
jgi:hypothetical protein